MTGGRNVVLPMSNGELISHLVDRVRATDGFHRRLEPISNLFVRVIQTESGHSCFGRIISIPMCLTELTPSVYRFHEPGLIDFEVGKIMLHPNKFETVVAMYAIGCRGHIS